jgi:phytochrome A
VNIKVNADGIVTEVFYFIPVPSDDLQHARYVHQASERTTQRRLKAFSYTRHAINKPLSSVLYSRETLYLNEEEMRQVHVAYNCQHQLNKILADLDQDNIAKQATWIWIWLNLCYQLWWCLR